MPPGVLVSEVASTIEKSTLGEEEKSIFVKSLKSDTGGHSYNLPTNPTTSFWQTELHELHDHRSTEHLPEHSDIVIIGAGYAGVSVAYHLSEDSAAADKSITVLEARGPCSGATGRNGGHLRPDLYSFTGKYCDEAGAEVGVEVGEFEISHIRAIKRLVEREKIDCDFTLTRSYDVWCNEAAAETAQANYERMKARGVEYMDDVAFYTGKTAEGISGVKNALACASYTAATLWPYKFVLHFIAKLVASNRINLQTQTPCTSITPAPNGGYILTTPRGTIHATQVVHANNAYVGKLLPEYRRSIVPCKGICCRITLPTGSCAPLLNDSYIERDRDNTLSYLVPRTDGSIIVGGASQKFRTQLDQWYNNTDDSVLIDAAEGYYHGYMQRTFRGWGDSGAKVDQIWTGVMGYSFDDLPHVGAVPGREGMFVLAGWNGHGMPNVWRSGEGVARMVARGVGFEEIGVPRFYKTTRERVNRAIESKEGEGSILR